jgi:GNAT superfamily N-acetyltransferase
MEVLPETRLGVATGQDVPNLLALVQRAYRGESARQGWTHEADLLDGQRIDAEALASIIADDNHRILLAFDRDAMIGCVQISGMGSGRAYLGLLAVDPLRQTGGVGRLLLRAAESAAVELFGATSIEMTVIRQRADLIAYYERRGYRVSGESRAFPYGDTRFGLPRVDDLAFAVLVKVLGQGGQPIV